MLEDFLLHDLDAIEARSERLEGDPKTTLPFKVARR